MATIQLDLQENQALASNNFVKLNVGEENISWRFRLSRGNVPYNLTGSTVTFRVSGVNHKPITGGKYQPVDVQNGLFDWVFPAEMTQMSSGMYGFSDAQFMIHNGDVLDSSGNFVIRVAPTPGVIENYKGTIDEIDQMIQSSLNTIGDIQNSYQKVEADISKKLTDVGPVIDEFQTKLLTMTAEFNEATTKSNQTTEKANTAAINADVAATAANTAADKATASATAADTATSNANTATGAANDAADKANASATAADNATSGVNKAITDAKQFIADAPNNPAFKGPKGDEPLLSVLSNGNWAIDGKDSGKPARGEKGEPGSINGLADEVAKELGNVSISTLNYFDPNATVPGWMSAEGVIRPVLGTNAEQTTDYLPITANVPYIMQAWQTVPNKNFAWFSAAWYDADKVFISRPAWTGPSQTADTYTHSQWTTTAPANATYVRLSLRTYGNFKAKFSRGSKATDWVPAVSQIALTENTVTDNQVKALIDDSTASLAGKSDLNNEYGPVSVVTAPDFNGITNVGNYHITDVSGGANQPPDLSEGRLEVRSVGAGVGQTYLTDGKATTYYRLFTSKNEWSAWTQVASNTDLASISTRVDALEKGGTGGASIWSGADQNAYDALSAEEKAKYSLYLITG